MTAKIKLNAASGGGSVSLQAPSSSSNNRVYNLPDSAHISTLAGILEFDLFVLTTEFASNADITSNLERSSIAGAASPIGSGMTVSSGVFTFPQTGKYLVAVAAEFLITGDDNAILETKLTTDGTNFTAVSRAVDGNPSGTRTGAATSFAFLDIVNTSTHKVKFTAVSLASGSKVLGQVASDTNLTTFIFVRIGDT